MARNGFVQTHISVYWDHSLVDELTIYPRNPVQDRTLGSTNNTIEDALDVILRNKIWTRFIDDEYPFPRPESS